MTRDEAEGRGAVMFGLFGLAAIGLGLFLMFGCAATIAFGDASASLCHESVGGTLSDNAVKAAEMAAEGAARGAAEGLVPVP